MGPINTEDLGLESTFKKIEEVNEIAEDLKENEEIEILFKIVLT